MIKCNQCNGVYEDDTIIIKDEITEICPNCGGIKVTHINYAELTEKERNTII